ncbi:MAG: iron transporter [Deltaproteobacteria bacterium]|nr:iron transporter [Deltaproteobacteria bacterium]
MTNFRDTAKSGIMSGIEKGWSGYVWLLKILIPISFLTLLLDYSGLIQRTDFMLAPVMKLINMPAAAAIPLVVGMLTGIYGGIAAMIVLPFSVNQMTLIAIFLLISHNLVQEGMVQGRSGLRPLKATAIRLAASIATVIAVAQFMDLQTGASATVAFGPQIQKTLWEVIEKWGISTFFLCIKIFLIVMALMIALCLMKAFDIIPFLVKVLKPFLKIMGLDERVGLLWLTAVVFGIAYGAAVIVEEAKEGNFSAEELERLHISIGINHSMVEDPTLFASLGLSVFWLWIPRVVTAIVAVYLFDIWKKWSNRGNRPVAPV